MLRNRTSKTSTGPSLVAAATTVNSTQLRATLSNGRNVNWTDAAWMHYDICGELRFGCTWIGNTLSRARLFAAYLEDGEDEPVAREEGRPAELVAEIHGGAGGQAQMLQRLGVHFSVPGESFVVTFTGADGEQVWATLCSDEIQQDTAGTITITLDGEKTELPEEHLVIRMWRPHPRRHWEADSPTRGLLPVLHELERLTAHVIAQTESRLAGSGLLLIPDNITFPVQDEQGNDTQGNGSGQFLRMLTTAMVTPISNRDDASAVVPIIAQGSPEAIAAVKHLTFSTELDAASLELRKEAIRRLALGMDMPPEVLLGLSDANHWTGWLIDETGVKQHIEPLLSVVADAFTTGWLRPALIAEGHPEPERWVVWFDISELVNRPNRGPDAMKLFEAGELSGSALRREHGFGETDGPTLVARAQRELREIARGAAHSLDQPTIVRMLELLGYVDQGDLPHEVPGDRGPLPRPPGQGPPIDPSAPALPAPVPSGQPRALPRRPDASPDGGNAPAAPAAAADVRAVALQVVAQYAASAALDYAGKRLLASDRGFRSKYRNVPHHELHTHIPVTENGKYQARFMLEGAFRTFDQMPDLAPIRAVVEAHVHGLLVAGKPLNRARLFDEVTRAVTR